METQSKGQKIAADIAALLRARNPLLWPATREEGRVESLLVQAAGAAGYTVICWDVAAGFTTPVGRPCEPKGCTDPIDALNAIRAAAETDGGRNVWIMRDLPVWFGGGIQGAACLRTLRNLARFLPTVARDRAQAIVVISPLADVPPELSTCATVIEWPLPDKSEIAAILDAAISTLPEELKAGAAPNGTREAAIDAAVGLSGEEAAACYAKSLVTLRRIDPATVASEKKRVIARERVLEWFDPLPGGMDSVGGLENLKAWLLARKSAYTKAARDYGLPSPKGVMLVGVSGCGKSLTAKAIATNWGVPLLKIDLGALKSKFVGDSEANLRRAFKTIEAVGRCVVWFDEIEKSLAGATQGAADGGVSSDALGAVLTWMQERQGEAFVIATANDVSQLPPELLRKGRFDDLFFVDLPTQNERVAVLRAALKANGRKDVAALEIVAAGCKDYTGAEIAALVPDAMYAAFSDGAREISAADLTFAAKAIVPLSTTMKEKLTALRNWAATRARPASIAETVAAESAARQIDLA